MKKIIEGSRAVAEAVALCRPNVVSAYPITPQTHIVEELAQMVADGDLKAEFVNVESEHSAASVVLGACATGARVFTASSSQGLLLMGEVLFNIAGMRLPVVLTCANRAVSAPLNIWNDQQDSIALRDAGVIQLYAENNQETADMHIQAYKIAERVLLPVMVCMDGYVLTHAYEIVDIPEQALVDQFLPPYKPQYYLTPKNPLSFGMYAEPDKYHEIRYTLQQAVLNSAAVIEEVAEEFKRVFGRYSGGLIDTYRMDDAETVILAAGSILGTIKAAVDELRDAGQKVGVLKLRVFRPFPAEALYKALANAKHVVVIDRAVSLGYEGPIALDLKAAFYGRPKQPQISGFIAGLGGRDVTVAQIKDAIAVAQKGIAAGEFLALKRELLEAAA
jgi:pyruvate ferredoxin oxidoreductase alpha subunit